ncbi:hypothetical protein BgiMline_009112 [Biomphalaria glabrata]|nr:hypothetical protein BgiMline_027678 [Biomphalaria glabrata]KAI8784693.1 hypothetical protein BgiBS90_014220 [Biomphalaria glabrata]
MEIVATLRLRRQCLHVTDVIRNEVDDSSCTGTDVTSNEVDDSSCTGTDVTSNEVDDSSCTGTDVTSNEVDDSSCTEIGPTIHLETLFWCQTCSHQTSS